ncbi:MAG: hypothetical protein A2126_01015 [Candidatus Woykebacteria bacterium GWB1_45_5]|uniref:Uncharacterized protein n=2 Tax=Candidatus Woykeibacteriota TaxID=1817899 RepID=A0A1G1W2Q4_9BACT|nr:MAG: hypothetical protein A2113_01310 [Candidatus Woykebacteria bacterium GWA1_44_8]OGY23990.1 MAG: hypothetical protein A2126_01015 [Candidatus Woykebacteria bacterium GWB1_45_5]
MSTFRLVNQREVGGKRVNKSFLLQKSPKAFYQPMGFYAKIKVESCLIVTVGFFDKSLNYEKKQD